MKPVVRSARGVCSCLLAGLVWLAATSAPAAPGPAGDEYGVGDRAFPASGWRTSCTDAQGNRTSIEQACSGSGCDHPDDLVLRRFDADGNPRAVATVKVNETPALRFNLRVACSNAGWVVAQWFDQGGCVLQRVFDPDGTPLSSPLSAVPADRDCRSRSTLVIQDGGSVMATWAEAVSGIGSRIVARRFDPDAKATSDGFTLSEDLQGWQRQPKIAIDETGQALVTWLGDGEIGPWFGAVLARFVDADGKPASDIFRVNSFDYGSNADPAVSSTGSGTFEVLWNNVLEGGRVGRLVSASAGDAAPQQAAPTAKATQTATLPRFSAPRVIDADVAWRNDTFGRELTAGSASTWLLEKYTPASLRTADDGVYWTTDIAGNDERVVQGTDAAGVWIRLLFQPQRDVYFTRSDDNAATWSAPALLASIPQDVCDGCTFRRADVRGTTAGTWVAVWSYDVEFCTNDGHCGPSQRLAFSRSTDSGKTWSALRHFTLSGDTTGGLDLEADGKGNWVMTWMGSGISLFRSADDGKTWDLATGIDDTLCTDCERRWRYHRVKVAADGNGTWLAIFSSADYRTDLYGHDGDVFVMRSLDNAATWSDPAALYASAGTDGSPDFEPSIAVDKQGRWLATWTSHRPTGDGDDLDADILLAMSTDAGATWSVPQQFSAVTDDRADDGAPLLAAGEHGWMLAWRSSAFEPDAATPGTHVLMSAAGATCGNGQIEIGEACDDAGTADNDGCDSNCTLTGCGNGIVTGDEECDDANDRSDDECVHCRWSGCGDGIVGPDEACDDGNRTDGDGCTNDCQIARCGDRVVADDEECDDGNSDDTDACPGTCHLATCGDGFLHSYVEACDDGNSIDDDACPNDCSRATCGDGQTAYGIEECDWADPMFANECTHSCRLPDLCGDANADEKVTIADALWILRRAVGLPMDCPRSACDMDGSGRIGIRDAQMDLAKAVGLPVGERCSIGSGTIVFWIDDPREIAALQLAIDYKATGGDFTGSGSSVACESLLAEPEFGTAFNDDDDAKVLRAGIINVQPFTGPLDLFRCRFELPQERTGVHFAIRIEDATDEDFEALEPPPLLGYRLE